MTATAEREKLRNAIADQQAAERVLDEAMRAANNAREKWSAVSSRIGEITREIEDAQEHAEHSTDDVIASLASGGDILEKPSTKLDELRAQLAEAENESERWRRAIDLAEQAIEFRRQAVDLAAHYVDTAARAVVTKEVDAAALLCHAEGLRSQLLDAQSRLAALASSMEHASEQRRTVDNFLTDGWLIDAPWRNRPAGRKVKDAFGKLKIDADTALKVN